MSHWFLKYVYTAICIHTRAYDQSMSATNDCKQHLASTFNSLTPGSPTSKTACFNSEIGESAVSPNWTIFVMRSFWARVRFLLRDRRVYACGFALVDSCIVKGLGYVICMCTPVYV